MHGLVLRQNLSQFVLDERFARFGNIQEIAQSPQELQTIALSPVQVVLQTMASRLKAAQLFLELLAVDFRFGQAIPLDLKIPFVLATASFQLVVVIASSIKLGREPLLLNVGQRLQVEQFIFAGAERVAGGTDLGFRPLQLHHHLLGPRDDALGCGMGILIAIAHIHSQSDAKASQEIVQLSLDLLLLRFLTGHMRFQMLYLAD